MRKVREVREVRELAVRDQRCEGKTGVEVRRVSDHHTLRKYLFKENLCILELSS